MSDATPPAPHFGKPRKARLKRIPESWDIFAGHVAAGDQLTDAYRKAYRNNKSNPNTLKKDASKLARRPEVAILIDKYKREEIQGCLLSRDERLQILGQIAKSKVTKPTDKIGAIREYTKIVGDASPERSEIELKNPIVGAASFVEMSVQQRAEALIKQMEADSPP
jgi:hypothetical protein